MPVVTEQEVLTPSDLNRIVRELLETGLPMIRLEGEISNLSRPGSGHCYFSLKDGKAQVRCALFRNRAARITIPLRNGLLVLIRARVSLYEARGDFQLIVEQLAEAGEGALRRAFEALRQRLATAGLFAVEHKHPLPRFARRIGVITSPSGAALRDVLSVLGRRFPGLPVLLYPTVVQGADAGAMIARRIAQADQRAECDVLLLVRGGGSLEDLWAFNEEVLARAIHACRIPIVSGVGHETDVTIADFVADVRAPTPSAAAELVSPDRAEWLAKFASLERRLTAAGVRIPEVRRQRLNVLQQRLARTHPGRRLQQQAQLLDELALRLQRAMQSCSARRAERLAGLAVRLRAQSPLPRIRRMEQQRQMLARRLVNAWKQRLGGEKQRLNMAARALHAVSPLQILGRGYALARLQDGTLLRRADQVQPGEQVDVRLAQGELHCRVESVEAN